MKLRVWQLQTPGTPLSDPQQPVLVDADAEHVEMGGLQTPEEKASEL